MPASEQPAPSVLAKAFWSEYVLSGWSGAATTKPFDARFSPRGLGRYRLPGYPCERMTSG